MIKKETIIQNETGLHARPAARFVNKTKEYSSRIILTCGDKKVDGKSIMSIMTLGATRGKKIIIQAEGEDEEKAVNELIQFLDVELPTMDKVEE